MADQTDLTAQEHRPSFRLVPRRDRPYPEEDEISMFDQPDLMVPVIEPPPPQPDQRKPTIEQRFLAYHEAHPEVYDEFVRLARGAKSKGHNRIGMKMLGELVRWHFIIDREYDEEAESSYSLNNVLLSRYARLIMENEVDLAGMFTTRKLKSK